MGLVGRRGRRGRPPKLCVTMPDAEQQAERRRDRLQEVSRRKFVKVLFFNLSVSMTTACGFQVVKQCEDEELMDIVLPRLTKVLSLWELLLAKVKHCDALQNKTGRCCGPWLTSKTICRLTSGGVRRSCPDTLSRHLPRV